jgi:hypothetical protein
MMLPQYSQAARKASHISETANVFDSPLLRPARIGDTYASNGFSAIASEIRSLCSSADRDRSITNGQGKQITADLEMETEAAQIRENK